MRGVGTKDRKFSTVCCNRDPLLATMVQGILQVRRKWPTVGLQGVRHVSGTERGPAGLPVERGLPNSKRVG